MTAHDEGAGGLAVAKAGVDELVIGGDDPAKGQTALIGDGFDLTVFRVLTADGGQHAGDFVDLAGNDIGVDQVEGVGRGAFARHGFMHGAEHHVVDAETSGDIATVDQRGGGPEQAGLAEGAVDRSDFELRHRVRGFGEGGVGAQETLLHAAVEAGLVVEGGADFRIAADDHAPARGGVAEDQRGVKGDPAVGGQRGNLGGGGEHGFVAGEFVDARADFVAHRGDDEVDLVLAFGEFGKALVVQAVKPAANLIPVVKLLFGLVDGNGQFGKTGFVIFFRVAGEIALFAQFD